MKGVKAMKQASLAPEKTVTTLENLKEIPAGAKPRPQRRSEPEDNRTSQEIKKSVCGIEESLAETLDELERRLTFASVREQAKTEINSHPYRWGLIALGTGFAGSLFMKRDVRPGILKWSALAVRTFLPLLYGKRSPTRH
jgi:hypothetical protein